MRAVVRQQQYLFIHLILPIHLFHPGNHLKNKVQLCYHLSHSLAQRNSSTNVCEANPHITTDKARAQLYDSTELVNGRAGYKCWPIRFQIPHAFCYEILPFSFLSIHFKVLFNYFVGCFLDRHFCQMGYHASLGFPLYLERFAH